MKLVEYSAGKMEHIQKQEQIDIDHLIQTIVSNT